MGPEYETTGADDEKRDAFTLPRRQGHIADSSPCATEPVVTAPAVGETTGVRREGTNSVFEELVSLMNF